jgi:hypothetical protein
MLVGWVENLKKAKEKKNEKKSYFGYKYSLFNLVLEIMNYFF